MLLELLFLLFLVCGICAIAYRGAIHEFMILQKEYSPDMNWSELLGEQVPLVIRNVPKTWLGSWTHMKTQHRPWDVYVKPENGKRLKTTWKDWLHTPDALPPLNANELAVHAKLHIAVDHMHADGFRRWYWLPSFQVHTSSHVLGSKDIIPLQKNKSESLLLISTDGAPIELWLAHEGAVPSHISSDIMNKDPWNISAKETPWIGEVKYIEIKLRPGNAISIPSHWYFAIRKDHTQKNNSWFWIMQQHTVMSWFASRSQPYVKQIKQ